MEQIHQFDQKIFINYINKDGSHIDKAKLRETQRLIQRYNGLCDIICNHITSENILGDDAKITDYSSPEKNTKPMVEYGKTHVLNVNSLTRFFQLVLCIIFKYYPESPLSFTEQLSINSSDKTKKKAIYNKCLDEMQNGDYYKVCIVEKKYNIPSGGHSTLIYKNNNTFTFFDPNFGATTGMTKDEIYEKISELSTSNSEVAIMDNRKFLSRHYDLKEITRQTNNLRLR